MLQKAELNRNTNDTLRFPAAYILHVLHPFHVGTFLPRSAPRHRSLKNPTFIGKRHEDLRLRNTLRSRIINVHDALQDEPPQRAESRIRQRVVDTAPMYHRPPVLVDQNEADCVPVVQRQDRQDVEDRGRLQEEDLEIPELCGVCDESADGWNFGYQCTINNAGERTDRPARGASRNERVRDSIWAPTRWMNSSMGSNPALKVSDLRLGRTCWERREEVRS